MSRDPYFGPGPELMAMMDRAALVDPRVMPPEADDEHLARRDRMVACETFDELTPADQAWLTQACLAVSAGQSTAVSVGGDDLIGGDWQAEDAALDAGGPIPVRLGSGESDDLTPDDLDELAMYESEPLDVPEGDWVGL